MDIKKALIVTTISGFVPQFEMNNVKILESMGYQVHYASNYNTPVYGNDNSRLDNTKIIRHQVNFVRSPFGIPQNIKAYKQLKDIMKREKFDLVHCHTPMGGVLARLAAAATKTAPVLYTAHGFHFYHGSPFINWIMYYPVERLLAHYTDVLITINKEDYRNAKQFRFRKNGSLVHINGIGIDTKENINKYVDKTKKRKELGIKQDTFLITSVGEITKRKNHKVVLQALAKLKNKNIKYILCGTGSLEEELKYLVQKLQIQDRVIFAGYRKDVNEILKISDCFVFPSLQEGLSVALLEAMTEGLPVICSKIRGNTDLIKDSKGGYLIEPSDSDSYANAIKLLYENDIKRKAFGEYNQRVVNNFDINIVSKKMKNLYSRAENIKKLK